MKYYRPFCKANTTYSTGVFEVNFQDTAGNLLDCNYINVGIAGSLNQVDIFEMELIGTSGLQSFVYTGVSGSTTSGAFEMTFFQNRPVEVILPPGIVANGVRINRTFGTGTRAIYINYGVVKEENPLKPIGKYKGV